MSFARPALLLGLLLLPLAVLVYAAHERRRGRTARAWAPAALLPSVLPHRPGWRRHGPPLLYALALAALVLALARPQATRAVPVEQARVVLATDFSASMRARDVEPSRLDAARAAAGSFLDRVPDGVRVGAVGFHRRAFLLRAPTTDREDVRDALAARGTRFGTVVGDGLALALRAARPPAADGRRPPAAIVLLTDGTSSGGRDALEVAREARRARVPVHTVALGTDSGAIEVPAPGGGTRTEPVPPDPAALELIAEETRGRSFSAGDAEALDAVYEELGSQVATREQPREVTAAAAGGALLLLLVGGGLSLRWFGRLP